jgi:hypothetical protein
MTEAERSGAATSGSSTLTSRVRRASSPLVLVSHARFGEARRGLDGFPTDPNHPFNRAR